MAPGRRTRLDVRGDLQARVLAAVWKLGRATVEDVRNEQPARQRSAYTTVQTVMTRLVEKGLLDRRREGKAFVYSARLDESEYLVRAIGDRLADVSPDARKAALVRLVEGLEAEELDEVLRYANRIKRERKGT
jgi:predicted transcriptional regulator